jgi:threonine synthase
MLIIKEANLICVNCGRNFEGTKIFRCPDCASPLDLLFDGHGIESSKTRSSERYHKFFPFEPNEIVSLGEGNTPLIYLPRLAEKIGVRSLGIKNESVNPTWSFKDRGTSCCTAHAKALGFNHIGTVSSGNMAASVAAYGAYAGLQTTILVKGDLSDEKLAPIAIYGAKLFRVAGNYDDVYSASFELGKEKSIYFMNSDVPFRVAGSRTISFEIAESLYFDVPEWIIVPTSAGGNIRGIISGFMNLKILGYTSKTPRLICAQATGCSPIVEAFLNGKMEVERFPNPQTIAHGIENPFPPSGNETLALLKKYNGIAISVSEESIISAQAELASNGLFGQPESAVPIGAAYEAKSRGIISETDRVVTILTGAGLKYTAAFEKHKLSWRECHVNDLHELI